VEHFEEEREGKCLRGFDWKKAIKAQCVGECVFIVVLRKAESHEPSLEGVSHHKAADGSDQFTSEDILSMDVAASDTVIDEQDYFCLPEPPDLSTLMPSLTFLPADTAEQLPEDNHVEAENAVVDKSYTTVL